MEEPYNQEQIDPSFNQSQTFDDSDSDHQIVEEPPNDKASKKSDESRNSVLDTLQFPDEDN